MQDSTARAGLAPFAKLAFIAIVFVWCGLVLGLSFIETPLKFMAPGITLELGLGIGRLVFDALNKIEIAFTIIGTLLLIGVRPGARVVIGFAIVAGIVALQTFILLPILDHRVEVILGGGKPPQSPLHLVYVAAELTKLGALAVTGLLFARAALTGTAGR